MAMRKNTSDHQATSRYHVASSEAGRLEVSSRSADKLKRAGARVTEVQRQFNARHTPAAPA
jgi:hypothetical protein